MSRRDVDHQLYWDASTEADESDITDMMTSQIEIRNRFSDGTSVALGPCCECGYSDLANVVFNARWLCYGHYKAACTAGEEPTIFGYPEPQALRRAA